MRERERERELKSSALVPVVSESHDWILQAQLWKLGGEGVKME